MAEPKHSIPELQKILLSSFNFVNGFSEQWLKRIGYNTMAHGDTYPGWLLKVKCLWLEDFIIQAVKSSISWRLFQLNRTTSVCSKIVTSYRMAHGISFSTVGDLFEVAATTACQIFSTTNSASVAWLYDRFVCLLRNEEWKKRVRCFLENWNFLCMVIWDAFNVCISSYLLMPLVIKATVSKIVLIGHSKWFLWGEVGSLGSMHY